MKANISLPQSVTKGFKNLKKGSSYLRNLAAEEKNAALLNLAKRLKQSSTKILAANAKDLASFDKKNRTNERAAFRDRLKLDKVRISSMAESLIQVAKLPDPVNEIIEKRKLKNGLHLTKVRSPLGVLFMVFESRPNIVTEVFSLAFKSGNAIALRGGSEAKETIRCLYKLMRESLGECQINPHVFLGIEDYDRSLVEKLLARKDWIDVVIPRGGDKLIELVSQKATMPIIKNDRGMCHAYVDDEANLDMAASVVANAKTSRPGVCNSLETVLVHQTVADKFLPKLYKASQKFAVEWRCDKSSQVILKNLKNVRLATPEDWHTEHLAQILNCKIVENMDEAILHIETYGSRHSETIITGNKSKARQFQNQVDSAAVYWNASTRFTDGFEFGLGGEIGISTQKLHVRGPVGLRELTTPRWLIDGHGQIRGESRSDKKVSNQ